MDIFNQLLKYYDISLKDYQHLTREVSFSDVIENKEFANYDKAVSLIKEAINAKDKILIYGDYDTDGIMSISIIKKMFQYISYPVDYYIPSRYLDGYGINISKAKEYVSEGYNLIITVDNGVSANEAIDYLINNGVKVLILDHHEREEKDLPNANAFMHPLLSRFSNINSSGAFTSFMFSYYFLGRYDKYLATLAAISIVSDMMPMVDYNRDFMRVVTKEYKKGEFLAIDLLLDGKDFSYASISDNISPKVNSFGRVLEKNDPQLIEYFTSDDDSFVLNYISVINDTNLIKKSIIQEANQAIKYNNEGCYVEVVDVKEGVLGLLASTIINKYKVPAIVLTKNGDFYKASTRSPVGFDMFKALTSIDVEYITFGGHTNACGFSIDEQNLNKLKVEFKKYCESNHFDYVEKEPISLSITDINFDVQRLIDTFSPFGEQWKAPKLAIKHLSTKNASFIGKTGDTLRINVGYSSSILAFKINKEDFLSSPYVDAYGTLELNSFNGKTSVQFKINEYNKII